MGTELLTLAHGWRWTWLWTDLALWAVFGTASIGALLGARRPDRRALWRRLLHDPAALGAGLVMALLLAVALLDSVHLRPAVAPGVYDTRVVSLLDVALARQWATRETSYSAPLAWQAFDTAPAGDGTRQVHPRLAFGGAHLTEPAAQWQADVLQRALFGLGAGLALAALATAVLVALRRGRLAPPWRAPWLVFTVLCLLIGPAVALAGHYHVLGTDRTGNDVLLQALKSLRTAFVIGTLPTLAMVPLAVGLGIAAGWYGRWVDDAMQYLYTVLSSIPGVLLIAACVLMLQVQLDRHPDAFDTAAERADVKVFLLCAVLGLTGWATLCRLVRAETLKLRELGFVQAATAFGVPAARIMLRHLLPNVMHLVVITTVLGFSDLILYEAVLTYVGVGVDPATSSFGGMINLARSEMSRDPVVWWSFAAAFAFMLGLVLAANLLADAVREAFDPRATSRAGLTR